MYKKKIVILIDGHSYLYRIYYAKLKNTHARFLYTKIIYSFLYVLKNILLQYKPETLIIIFDSKKKNFRNQLFKNYKANRPNMPNLLKIILLKIQNILINIGIPTIIIPKFEADDVIGTLSNILEKKGQFVLIITCDKDLSQLINKNIYVLNHINNNILNTNTIKKQYGIYPNLIIDFLSLTGDAVDNIPGVIGIGKKTAILLLQKIGNIKKIYNNLKKISTLNIRGKKNIIDKLKQGKKMAFLSYKLAKIKIDVPINQKYQSKKLLSLFYPCTFDNVYYIKIIYELKNIIINNT
ncbi:5'-3' exonuclease H3TH domain-containing protein [Buchnera aphidicola (Takecallis taiwana)]|uniref:5'-3' exonuclease n=1 Tax=Buchnera aphidicola TaxID=9 RepID=UPI0031B6CC4E